MIMIDHVWRISGEYMDNMWIIYIYIDNIVSIICGKYMDVDNIWIICGQYVDTMWIIYG